MRIVRSRDSDMTARVFVAAQDVPPNLLDLVEGLASQGNGRWVYPHLKTDDRGYSEWGMHPSDAPASFTDPGKYDSPKTVFYDPARASVKPGEFRPEITYTNPSAIRRLKDANLPAGYLWRGMSDEEYQAAQQRGYFESSGDYNIGGEHGDNGPGSPGFQAGRTFFTTDPDMADSYANGFAPWQYKPTFSRPAHVVGIPDQPDAPRGPLGNEPKSHEVGLTGRIPFNSIAHHWVGHVSDMSPGRWVGYLDSDPPYRGASASPSVQWEPGDPPSTAQVTEPPKLAGRQAALQFRSPGKRSLEAYDGDARVGELSWHPDGEIDWISVHPGHRRKGIGTQLFQQAQQVDPTVSFSPVMSEAGHAWSKSQGYDPQDWELLDARDMPDDREWLTASIFPPHDEGDWANSNAPAFRGMPEPAKAPEGAKWYHVSKDPLLPGEQLRPFGGQRGYGQMYDKVPAFNHRDQHVWMEHNPEVLAEHWAHPDRTPYIYEIEPHEQPQPWNADGSEGWVADGATVKRQISDNGWLPMDFTAALTDPRYVDPAYFAGTHEMGHALDFAGDFESEGKTYDTVLEVWKQEHPGEKPPWGPGDPRMMQWVRQQLPMAAFQGDEWAKGRNYLNGPEALAHAFTEVRLNPQANGLSQALNKLLTDSMEYAPPHGGLSVGPGVPKGFTDAISDVQADHPQADIARVDLTPENSFGPAWMEGPGPYATSGEADIPPRMRIDQQYANPADPGKLTDWMDQRVDMGHYPRWESTTATEPWPEDQIADFSDEYDRDHAPKVAMAYGDPPPDLTDHQFVVSPDQREMLLQGPWGNTLSKINWNDGGEVMGIYTSPDARHNGYASALFDKAKSQYPHIHHSETLTDDGAAWSKEMYQWTPQDESIYDLQFAASRRAFIDGPDGFTDAFADPDGTGVWKVHTDAQGRETTVFIQAPHVTPVDYDDPPLTTPW